MWKLTGLKVLPCQVLHHLRHLGPASQKLTHLLISQACLQANPLPQMTHPPWGSTQAFSPAAKGELLMASVMAMAQPSQHTQGPAALLKTLLSFHGLAAAAQTAIAKVGLLTNATAAVAHVAVFGSVGLQLQLSVAIGLSSELLSAPLSAW